jgi:NAD(P)-dependent dehydrogenase (short-subunit alcohol dehydrogenase family)
MSSVLVTGASKGIGRAIARELAARGHRVVATARDPRTLEDLDVAARLALDVTDPASVAEAVSAAGEVDVLVSNAGVIFHAPVESLPLEATAALFEANTFGALRMAQAVLPQMRGRGSGRLLFMSSVLGRIALPASGAYAASKWALEALAETLALEVAPYGVGVTLLEPGPVASGALDDVRRYPAPEGAYEDLYERRATGMGADSVETVAAAVADAAEAEDVRLRVPVGEAAHALLADRS